jgi:predicted metal-dependent phosphotriesterase family hydrolase
MTTIRTVTGDLRAAEVGRVDCHEHLFQVTPLLPGDDLTDEAASTTEAGYLARSGFDAMVDATPFGLGRRPLALLHASRTARLLIVATTGAHRSEHYADQSWVLELSTDDMVARFRADVIDGMPPVDRPQASEKRTDARAGVLKAGIGYWRIDAFERRVIEAVGEVHRETGCPVMVHTEFATAAHEVLDLLHQDGVPPDRVVLAHVDRNPDPGLHAELASRGAYLGYDGAARARSAPDSVILNCLASVVAAGHAGSLLIGGDVARATRYRAYGGMPGLEYLGTRFLPRLRKVTGDAVVETIIRTNPQRLLMTDLLEDVRALDTRGEGRGDAGAGDEPQGRASGSGSP